MFDIFRIYCYNEINRYWGLVMMTIGGTAHIMMVVVSIILIVGLCVLVARVSYKWQCVIIHSSVGLCMAGILFLHLTRYGTTLDFKNFFEQIFQVCNFNFILLPLCLIKKNELARQYLFYFSMFSAMSTFVSYTSDVEGSMWYSIIALNFWLDHFLVIAITFMMISARWFKPRKEYILPVIMTMILYFLSAFVANYLFNGCMITGAHNHSYTMDPGDIMILNPMFKLIPIPFVYLLPFAPILAVLFYLLSLIFRKYEVKEF